jgi:hypothetical protein
MVIKNIIFLIPAGHLILFAFSLSDINSILFVLFTVSSVYYKWCKCVTQNIRNIMLYILLTAPLATISYLISKENFDYPLYCLLICDTLILFIAIFYRQKKIKYKDKDDKEIYIIECNINDFMEKTKDDCLICLNDYNKNLLIVILPCNHIYHAICIYEWFEKKVVCPLCNVDLKGYEVIIVNSSYDYHDSV